MNFRLIVAEANKTGAEHATFNCAALQTLFRNAKQHGCHLEWYSDSAQRQSVISVGDQDLVEIDWHPIFVEPGLNRAFIKKFLCELTITIRLLLRARRERASIVFLSVFPNVLPFIFLVRRAFRHVPVHIILHGELESLLIPEKQAISREGFWVQLALLRIFGGSWPTLYVLGSGIRTRLLKHFQNATALRRIIAIEHPYPFSDISPHTRHDGQTRRIGFVGVGRRIKGVLDFFKLAQSFSTHIEGGELEFVLVGGLERSIPLDGTEFVRVLASHGAGLLKQDYERFISELDCAIFLSKENYTLTASGSVFDVINAGVEILALSSDYLTDISQHDVEGGIKFYSSLEALESELHHRIKNGWPNRTLRYPAIRKAHAPESLDSLIFRVFSSANRTPDRQN